MFACARPTAFAAQLELLNSLSPRIEALLDRHIETRDNWQPGSIMKSADDDELDALRELRRRAAGLSPEVKVSLALNMLTEEGLPNFHQVISAHVGEIPVWDRWIRLWTAEEDRHGNVLRDYSRDAALYHMARLDEIQFEYLRAGFNPDWIGSPYRLIAYTSLQERATQFAHASTGRAAAEQEPLLQRILAHMAGDELRHTAFYRDSYALILETDPDGGLLELASVAPTLDMPGQTMPGYLMMADIEQQAGIFGPREYAALVVECLNYWGIADIEPTGGEARRARDTLMELPTRLERLADVLDARPRRTTFEFDFLRQPLTLTAQ